MTTITINYKDDHINNITIKGHTGYSDFGKDIVCASISSITITSVNSILKFNDKYINYSEKDGFVSIEILENNNITNTIITNMIDLLKELAIQYPKNIKIIEEV